jgi:predicted nucleic acid-binding protein
VAELIVADASVLIGWLDDSDPHHEDAIRALSSVERFVVHPLTLAEVLVHPARTGREGAVIARLEAVGMIVSTLPLDPATLARLRATTRLKMPDCVVLACAEGHGLGVASFDESLRVAAQASQRR